MSSKNTLRTLKDLNKYAEGTDSDILIKHHHKNIKQEAIKWVKEDRKEFGITFQGEFWQHRLNITEEDLKDKEDEDGCPYCGRTDYRKVHKDHFCSKKCRKRFEDKQDEKGGNK